MIRTVLTAQALVQDLSEVDEKGFSERPCRKRNCSKTLTRSLFERLLTLHLLRRLTRVYMRFRDDIYVQARVEAAGHQSIREFRR